MNETGLVPELAVANAETSLKFYINILGFEILFQREEENFAYLKKGNAEIMLDQIGSTRTWSAGELEPPLGRGVNFQIEVDSVDDLYHRVQANSIVPFLPLEDKWYRRNDKLVGNRQFIVQDPDGYLLRFYQDLGTK
jgi:catechol 2,3-dioxygenase-like lactoylglutathione lyase family enzyme